MTQANKRLLQEKRKEMEKFKKQEEKEEGEIEGAKRREKGHKEKW